MTEADWKKSNDEINIIRDISENQSPTSDKYYDLIIRDFYLRAETNKIESLHSEMETLIKEI